MKPEVLIIGSSSCALRMARNIVKQDAQVLLASPNPLPADQDHEGIQLLQDARLVSCSGYSGAFAARLRHGGSVIDKQVAAIAVATDAQSHPNYKSYGLESSSRVLDIRTLEAHIDEKRLEEVFTPEERVVFFNGWENESHPAITARILAACLTVQKQTAARTFLITGNLKVAGNGLEAACREARDAGTVIVKCTERFPDVQALSDGRTRIRYRDDVTREYYELNADHVVVDETLSPDPMLADLVQILALEKDPTGFAQGDNVRRLNNLTNRRGIFMAGSARGVMSLEESDHDADHAAIEVMAFLNDADREQLPGVTIDPGRCARCLTCYRICPHAAIDIGSVMAIMPQACQSCGICAAGCPARAIDVEGLQATPAAEGWSGTTTASQSESDFEPRIAVFCCARSAGLARNLATAGGRIFQPGIKFIEVPCGGAISMHHMLQAFEAGADGVMLLTCHPDNCKSQQGSTQARLRMSSANQALAISDIATERLHLETLAANMGSEFFNAVSGFHRKIKELGPWAA